MSINNGQRYLAFDYGEKRIGVASGNTLSHTTATLDTVANSSGTPEWQQLDDLVQTWQPVALIVGDPLTETGEVVEITRQARGFAKRLTKRYKLPVHTIDERYSSIEASDRIKSLRRAGARGRTQRGDIDKVAAALLMQRWFDENC